MPFDVLERKLRSLPEQSFEEVSNFFDYILFKFGKEEKDQGEDAVDAALVAQINQACRNHPQNNLPQEAVVAAMWEAVKNDSW